MFRFRRVRNGVPFEGLFYMFKENNVSGKHVSFQANTKWSFILIPGPKYVSGK